MKPKKPRPYTNQLLTEPIDKDVYFRRGTIADGENFETKQAIQFATLTATKLAALYKHYQLDQNKPNSAHDLVLKLAEAHVPGFQIKSMKDPREYWDSNRLMWLDATFQKLRPQFDSDMAAYEHIAESGEYHELTRGVGSDRLKEIHHRKAGRAEFNAWLEWIESLKEKGESEEIISKIRQIYLERMAKHPINSDD